MYIDKLPEDAVKIKNSTDYIDRKGNVYGIESRKNNKHKGQPFIKSLSKVYGYKYCGINYNNGRHISKRVHKLVAEAFIPNPNNYPIVMHINNNKQDNRVENLKWGTISENTKQAANDNLLKNKKGFEDSQSIPCTCYNTLTNELVGHFGSVTIASNTTGISISGIMYQLKNPNKQIRVDHYFVKYKDLPKKHSVIVQLDFNTDKELNRFINIGQASSLTKINTNTINYQISLNKKPNWALNNYYFKRIII